MAFVFLNWGPLFREMKQLIGVIQRILTHFYHLFVKLLTKAT